MILTASHITASTCSLAASLVRLFLLQASNSALMMSATSSQRRCVSSARLSPEPSCWRTYVDSLTRHSANTANTYCVPSPTWDTTCRSSSCKRPTTASHNCGRGLSLSASAMTSQAVSHFHIQRLILNRHRQSARSCKTSWQKLAGKVSGNGKTGRQDCTYHRRRFQEAWRSGPGAYTCPSCLGRDAGRRQEHRGQGT